jgi:hypothetical protein
LLPWLPCGRHGQVAGNSPRYLNSHLPPVRPRSVSSCTGRQALPVLLRSSSSSLRLLCKGARLVLAHCSKDNGCPSGRLTDFALLYIR